MTPPLLIFDVDGTLTQPRRKITDDMKEFLNGVRASGVKLAVVGGSDLPKIVEQLGDSLEDVQSRFDYLFSENGVVGFKGSTPYPTKALEDELGEERLQRVINWTLEYFSRLHLPVKRGNFIEYRKGMLNLCPVGRSCSFADRQQFSVLDEEKGIRKKMVEEMKTHFSAYNLEFVIGGQISVDVFPKGWDKTFCLQYLEADHPVMHFFGDKTAPGGNDQAIFDDSRTVGHTVVSPNDTRRQVEALLAEQ